MGSWFSSFCGGRGHGFLVPAELGHSPHRDGEVWTSWRLRIFRIHMSNRSGASRSSAFTCRTGQVLPGSSSLRSEGQVKTEAAGDCVGRLGICASSVFAYRTGPLLPGSSSLRPEGSSSLRSEGLNASGSPSLRPEGLVRTEAVG